VGRDRGTVEEKRKKAADGCSHDPRQGKKGGRPQPGTEEGRVMEGQPALWGPSRWKREKEPRPPNYYGGRPRGKDQREKRGGKGGRV